MSIGLLLSRAASVRFGPRIGAILASRPHRIHHVEDADVPAALANIDSHGLRFNAMDTSYFLGRETLIATDKEQGMVKWREKLFAAMAQNAVSPTSFFRLPPNRVVELGAQVEL